MVPYILWFASVGGVVTRMAHSVAASSPPHPPRSAARDLLLYHHWLAELASGITSLLVYPRDYDRSSDWL